jgi:hypothetical protein
VALDEAAIAEARVAGERCSLGELVALAQATPREH